jgi:hypothetical protein
VTVKNERLAQSVQLKAQRRKSTTRLVQSSKLKDKNKGTMGI